MNQMNTWTWILLASIIWFAGATWFVLALPKRKKPVDPRDKLLDEIDLFLREYDARLDEGDDPQAPTGDDYNNVTTYIAHLLSTRRK